MAYGHGWYYTVRYSSFRHSFIERVSIWHGCHLYASEVPSQQRQRRQRDEITQFHHGARESPVGRVGEIFESVEESVQGSGKDGTLRR
jgi:hypothetical protein